MAGVPWYLRPPESNEPEPRTCLNCPRGCVRANPFYPPCPHWAAWKDLWIGGAWICETTATSLSQSETTEKA